MKLQAYREYNHNFFNELIKELEKLSVAKTKEDVMSNIAIATSRSMNSNLIPFFKNVLKFKLNIEAELLISKLPAINNKLIKGSMKLIERDEFESLKNTIKIECFFCYNFLLVYVLCS